MNEWKECPKCKCLNKGRERCQDCGRDLKDVAGDKPTPPITAGTKHVGISAWLGGFTLDKPWKCFGGKNHKYKTGGVCSVCKISEQVSLRIKHKFTYPRKPMRFHKPPNSAISNQPAKPKL